VNSLAVTVQAGARPSTVSRAAAATRPHSAAACAARSSSEIRPSEFRSTAERSWTVGISALSTTARSSTRSGYSRSPS